MGLLIACKAFWKALKNREEGKQFVGDQTKEIDEKPKEKSDHSHLQLLNLLQNNGRFIDFLQEDISEFDDAQVGAVVRTIHAECSKSLEELVTIRPLYTEEEGSKITLVEGYNPAEVKVVGNVKGKPPYKGTLKHKGWKAHKLSLPKQVGEIKADVIAPAEVEVV